MMARVAAGMVTGESINKISSNQRFITDHGSMEPKKHADGGKSTAGKTGKFAPPFKSRACA
jgi:hypothetical protein